MNLIAEIEKQILKNQANAEAAGSYGHTAASGDRLYQTGKRSAGTESIRTIAYRTSGNNAENN